MDNDRETNIDNSPIAGIKFLPDRFGEKTIFEKQEENIVKKNIPN